MFGFINRFDPPIVHRTRPSTIWE